MKHAVNYICSTCDSMFKYKLRSCCYCGGEVISRKQWRSSCTVFKQELRRPGDRETGHGVGSTSAG